MNLGSGNNIRLLVTGDFDADLKDEFAVMYYVSGGARLVWYDGGANATEGEWTPKNSPYPPFGSMFQDMSAGDVNNDKADDLVMVRNTLLTALDLRTWSTIAESILHPPLVRGRRR